MNDITNFFLQDGVDDIQEQQTTPNSARKGKTEKKADKERARLIVQIDDRDYQRIQDAASSVFRFWYCLQRMAYKKGNPFSASYVVLCRECNMAQKQIAISINFLEGAGMLSVKRGKTTRERNVYTLNTGVYVNHCCKSEQPSQKDNRQ